MESFYYNLLLSFENGKNWPILFVFDMAGGVTGIVCSDAAEQGYNSRASRNVTTL